MLKFSSNEGWTTLATLIGSNIIAGLIRYRYVALKVVINWWKVHFNVTHDTFMLNYDLNVSVGMFVAFVNVNVRKMYLAIWILKVLKYISFFYVQTISKIMISIIELLKIRLIENFSSIIATTMISKECYLTKLLITENLNTFLLTGGTASTYWQKSKRNNSKRLDLLQKRNFDDPPNYGGTFLGQTPSRSHNPLPSRGFPTTYPP